MIACHRRHNGKVATPRILVEKYIVYYFISVYYAPHVGCPCHEHLESEIRPIPLHEELIIRGDLNGHVGKDKSNCEVYHGGYWYG